LWAEIDALGDDAYVPFPTASGQRVRMDTDAPIFNASTSATRVRHNIVLDNLGPTVMHYRMFGGHGSSTAIGTFAVTGVIVTAAGALTASQQSLTYAGSDVGLFTAGAYWSTTEAQVVLFVECPTNSFTAMLEALRGRFQTELRPGITYLTTALGVQL
jgi:hypothetical protein